MRGALLLMSSAAAIMMAAAPASADSTFDACEAQMAKTAKTDSELGACGAAWVSRAEAKLASTWRTAFSAVGGSKSDQGQALLEEQRAWIAFKQKACVRYEVMSAGTLARFHDANVCLAEIIEDRISELSGDLHGKALS